MKSIDVSYQGAVDNEAEKAFELPIEQLIKTNDYGSIESIINGRKLSIGFWHYKLSDTLHHIIFQTDRRYFLIFHKKYLAGIKIDNGNILKLTDQEISDYD